MGSVAAENLLDTQAERLLVGCCILWPAFVIPKVIGRVEGSEFYLAKVGSLFTAIVRLHEAGRPVDDIAVLVADLKSQKELDAEVISDRFILEATKGIPSAANAVYYADRIRSLHRLRALLDLAKPLQEYVAASHASPDDVLLWLDGQVAKIRHNATAEAKPIATLWQEYIDQLEADLKKNRERALLSGFPAADRMGFVFAPGEMTVLAARPSVGKTAMASQIAMHHAKQGRCVLMASLEMGSHELGARMILAAAGKNHQLIRVGEYTQQDVNQLRVEAENIGERPFYVFAPGRVRVGVLHAAASVFHASRRLAMLVVDYLGLVRADDPSKPRHEQIGDVCKGLRDIAQKLEIPVLVLAQLNRQADGEIPTLAMLRESGDIEQDADQVAFLHPVQPPDGSDQIEQVSLVIAKNRQGARGTIPLDWHAEATRFSDPSEAHAWNPNR